MGGFFGVVSKTDCVTDLYRLPLIRCDKRNLAGARRIAHDEPSGRRLAIQAVHPNIAAHVMAAQRAHRPAGNSLDHALP